MRRRKVRAQVLDASCDVVCTSCNFTEGSDTDGSDDGSDTDDTEDTDDGSEGGSEAETPVQPPLLVHGVLRM